MTEPNAKQQASSGEAPQQDGIRQQPIGENFQTTCRSVRVPPPPSLLELIDFQCADSIKSLAERTDAEMNVEVPSYHSKNGLFSTLARFQACECTPES